MKRSLGLKLIWVTYLIDILCNPIILLAHDLILIKKKPKKPIFPFKLNGKWSPVGVTAIFSSFLPALPFTGIGREKGLLCIVICYMLFVYVYVYMHMFICVLLYVIRYLL